MEEIEGRAQAVLERLPDYIWDGNLPPIPVEEIADSHFGLLVRDVSPEEMRTAPGCPPLGDAETLSGLLIPSLGEIWVNAEETAEWPTRRRFTIAHELGHHLLHRAGQETLFCRRAMVEAVPEKPPTPERPGLPLPEQEANAFAAALLMPAELIEQYYESTRGDFDRLCAVFKSSGGAMGRRLHAVI